MTESKYIKTFCKNISTFEPFVFNKYSLYVPARQEQKFWKLIDKKYTLNNCDQILMSSLACIAAASKFFIMQPAVSMPREIHCIDVSVFLKRN